MDRLLTNETLWPNKNGLMPALVSCDKHAEKQEQDLLTLVLVDCLLYI